MNLGEKGEVTVDVTGLLESWILTSDAVGTLILDVQKCTLNDYPNFQSICGTDKPTISNSLKGSNDNLTLWTKEIIAGDILRVRVDQVNGIRRFMLGMKLLL